MSAIGIIGGAIVNGDRAVEIIVVLARDAVRCSDGSGYLSAEPNTVSVGRTVVIADRSASIIVECYKLGVGSVYDVVRNAIPYLEYNIGIAGIHPNAIRRARQRNAI